MTKLKVGILDFTGLTSKAKTASSTSIKEVQALREEIKKAGCEPRTYKVEKCQLYFHGRKSEILYNNKKIKGCDVLIPRVSVVSANVDLEISIVKQFQMMDIPVLNEYLPIARAKNKLRTMQILTNKNIPVPTTIVVRKLDYIDDAIKAIGGYPAILKTPFGSYGTGVVIVESRRALYSALDIIWKAGTNIILIQQYVAEADGSDFRAFVVGDRVVAAMQRIAKTGDFRSNLHLGGEARKAELTHEEERLAVRATEALGLHIAGVDLLRSKDGPLVMEVNSNPGFTGLSQISKVNVASEIVDYAIGYAKRHALDVKNNKGNS